MNDDTTTGHAYDPIADEDVEIECSPKHTSTAYDRIDGTELPVVIDSDHRHDPVEGCQGSFTEIIELDEGCPNCGYDRANRTIHTLAGEHRETCRVCKVDITDRHKSDWTAAKPTDRIDRMMREGSLLRRIDRLEVWESGNLSNTIGLYKDGSLVYLRDEDVIRMAEILLRNRFDDEDRPVDRRLGIDLFSAVADATPSGDDDE